MIKLQRVIFKKKKKYPIATQYKESPYLNNICTHKVILKKNEQTNKQKKNQD